MRRLSALHATSLSVPLVDVSRRGGALPSEGTSQRSDTCSFESYAGSITEKATSRPSGEIDGTPTLGISHNASWVTDSFTCPNNDALLQTMLKTTSTTRVIGEWLITACSPSCRLPGILT